MKRIGLFIFGMFVCGVAYAQTETTKWYIEGELYDTTTCESGGDINTPNVPARFGYTFSGWEPAVYDMSTLDATINGTSYTQNASTKKWSTMFSYGVVYGESLCSPTPNDSYILNDTGLDTTTGSGGYCWCRITEFMPSGSGRLYEPAYAPWVFRYDYGIIANCSAGCADRCGGNFNNAASVRRQLFGIN